MFVCAHMYVCMYVCMCVCVVRLLKALATLPQLHIDTSTRSQNGTEKVHSMYIHQNRVTIPQLYYRNWQVFQGTESSWDGLHHDDLALAKQISKRTEGEQEIADYIIIGTIYSGCPGFQTFCRTSSRKRRRTVHT